MVAHLLQGDEQVAGNVTSGGTESILLAVKTARDYARAHRPHITQPELVLSRTAHAAFHKAAHYLGVKPVVVGFDPVTFQADVDAMAAAITPKTILLVASAPCYSPGRDRSQSSAIATLAQAQRGLLCHVDACVGGIHLSFLRKLGRAPLPAFDFSVPGVTSLSVDMHKYGYAAKGASVILYRERSLRRYQIFSSTDTTAYTIINPTALSSRSGGPLAGAWAILNYLGEDGLQGDRGDRADGDRAADHRCAAHRRAACARPAGHEHVLLCLGCGQRLPTGRRHAPPRLVLAATVFHAHLAAQPAHLPDLRRRPQRGCAAGRSGLDCMTEVRAESPLDTEFIGAAAAALAADPSPEAIAGLMGAVGLASPASCRRRWR
jgi:sphinganine-1-phosphate aldolase